MARQLSLAKIPLHDGVCFRAQQCSEKYLKALLAECGMSIPKTHILNDLLKLLLPHHSSLRSLKRGLIFLTDFAVETRYPGENATKRQARSALRWMHDVRVEVRAILGLG